MTTNPEVHDSAQIARIWFLQARARGGAAGPQSDIEGVKLELGHA